MKQLPALLAFLFVLIAPVVPASAQAMLDEEGQAMYYFEHRFLPRMVFTSDGQFFDYLLKGNIAKLKETASEIVGPDFAQQLKVETIEPDKAVLITFAPPPGMPLCVCAIVAKTDDGFAYTTLEKTITMGDDSEIKTMYCAWTPDGTHQNFGPRTYDTPAAFVEEFRAHPDPGNPAAMTRPGTKPEQN